MFNYYNPFYSPTQRRWCPGIKPNVLDRATFDLLTDDTKLETLCKQYQQGDKEAKTQLPAVCWTGFCPEGKTRRADVMMPTQYYMVDVDHCDDPRAAWQEIRETILEKFNDINYKICLAHVTPSGRGLRIVARATQDFPTLKEHMEWLNKELNLEKYGDFDSCVKDLSRLSFMVPRDYILSMTEELWNESVEGPIKSADVGSIFIKDGEIVADDEKEHEQEYADLRANEPEYKGTKITTIIDAYVKYFGEPGDGERHTYYNNMVKHFRCIMDNNPRTLHCFLPRFGHTYAETLSQCQSICRTNTLSRLPKEFYFFLLNRGFYKKNGNIGETAVDEYLQNAPAVEPTASDDMPVLPPVFREIVGCMPKDFKVPCINALMPIMGTLTSHLRAEYPFDHRLHSTEFFSIIYAPPGTGKSFMEKYMELLHEDLKLRDMISSEREALYCRLINRKGSNEKAPDNPRVSLRCVMPKQSETDFLEKQQANQGHHMFTYAPEMDSWRKGVKAAGGNKDDMIRIAWDNGEYGQNFKSANSFKGTVKLFWNVLICGTLDQINAYFTNVENGLVTRCCFSAIENQEFVDVPNFKVLNKRQKDAIIKWRTKMDAMNYKEPLDFDPTILYSISEKDFDNEVPWKYEFKPFVEVDISWIMPTLKAFLKDELQKSALDVDHARDSFRRRVAVRGFRLALLCTSLYQRITTKEQKVIKDFVAWWMKRDLQGIMELFSERYNTQYDKNVGVKILQKGLYSELPDTFSRGELYAIAKRSGKKTKPRRILHDWVKFNAVVDNGDGTYTKCKKTIKQQ